MPNFTIGQEVVVRPDLAVGTTHDGAVYVVRSLPVGARGVNYRLDRVGGGRGLRASDDVLMAHDPNATNTARVTVEEIGFTPPPQGSVVTVSGPGWREDASILWVVLGESRKGGAKICRLGGDERGGYYPHVANALLTVVPLDAINRS